MRKRFSIGVRESQRSIEEYATLPASRYTVLDDESVQRVEANTFRVKTGKINNNNLMCSLEKKKKKGSWENNMCSTCQAGKQAVMWATVEPSADVTVEVDDSGVTQSIKEANLNVSRAGPMGPIMRQVNGAIKQVEVDNRVEGERDEEGARLSVEVSLRAEFTEGPLARAPERQLNSLASYCLDVAIPWFIQKLRDDFELWSQDGSRAELSRGEIGELTRCSSSHPLWAQTRPLMLMPFSPSLFPLAGRSSQDPSAGTPSLTMFPRELQRLLSHEQ